MTTIGGSATRAAWAGDSMVLGAMIVALVPMGDPVDSSTVDPIGAPVGDHVAVPGGHTLVGVGAVALAVAGQVPVGFGLGPALPGIGLVQRLMMAMAMTLPVVLARSAATASMVPSTAPARAARPMGAPSECGESA